MKFLNYYDKSQKIKKRKYSGARNTMQLFSKLYSIIIFPLLITAILNVFYFVFIKIHTFKIISFEVIGVKSYVNTFDMEELLHNQAYGKSIVFLDSKELEKILSENFLGANSIKVHKKLPSTIKVVIKERTPMALIYKEENNELFVIDSDGYVLGIMNTETKDLPRIKYDGDVKVGLFIDKNLIPLYFSLLGELDEKKIKASSMSLGKNQIHLYVGNSTEVLISSQKDIKSSITAFSELYKQLVLEGKSVSRIDLRYDKVIVSYD